jgi:hypothetical protein
MEPKADVSRSPSLGEEWAYRLRDDAPSERVHIVAVHQEGRRFRVDIRHLNGHPPGREENVPRSRLKVPWEDVVPYNASMDGWRRLKAESIDDDEASALWAALELVVPSEVAELSVASSDDSLTVHDHIAFETLTGQTVAAFQARFSWLGSRRRGVPVAACGAGCSGAGLSQEPGPGPGPRHGRGSSGSRKIQTGRNN